MADDSIRPAPLQAGDEVRVIAPSLSLARISPENRAIANARFAEMGVRLSFGRHVEECDRFHSSSTTSRVEDLHEAFTDDGVAAVLTVIGGQNCNQLLPFIDWDLIAAHPKIFCGFSDITILGCAIHARTGLVTFSGPHYSTFAMRQHIGQTRDWFRAMLFSDRPVAVEPATTWSDDEWFASQDDRTIRPNHGHWVLVEGEAEGRLIGGNLCTLNLLQGTAWMPDLCGAVVFVEDDYLSYPETFDRDLTSLTQQPGFEDVRGLLIGRFQTASEMTQEDLVAIIAANRRLDGMPIVANVDFGHTDPLLTIPIGGRAVVRAAPEATEIRID
ncbi:MAG: S66 family peptidase [Ilumatobacteraceae bacterium]